MTFKKNNQKSMGLNQGLITVTAPNSPVSEQYRAISANIQYAAVQESIQTMMVTSAGSGEGKTTVVNNLAIAFAQLGKKVLLVDADLRKPAIHEIFGTANVWGFSTVLAKQTNIEMAVVVTDIPNLWILPGGKVPANPAELLNSKAMGQFIEKAKEQFDYVLFDTPPLLAVADPLLLANQCDGSVLVVYSENTPIDKAKKAKELLESAKTRLLGVVVNRKEMKRKGNHSYYAG